MCGKIKFIISATKRIAALAVVFAVALFCGCSAELADLMDDDTTATEAKIILDRGSEIRAVADASNPLPEIYRRPPEILKTAKGWKLIYYARNHSPKSLSDIMKGQLKNSVSVADDTNQLIIDCADQADVDQVLTYLENIDVAPIQVKIDCIVIENYADITMDRETRVKIGDITGDSGLIVEGPDNGWGLFPGASIRESLRQDMGMSIGFDSTDLKFMVDMLVSRGYLKVLMNPTIETVTGKTATISSRDQMPTIKQVTDTKTREVYNLTEYIDVIDTLKVTPTVFADGSISIACEVKLSSKNTPEGVAQLPIVTERTINLGSSRLEPGKSLVVGGFRKSEKSSVVRGFPFLKDLPIIGMVFSSRDFEEKAKEVTFIFTPSISSGGIAYGDMLEKLAQEQFKGVDPNDIRTQINRLVTDPFGRAEYSGQISREREAESIRRLQAELRATEAEIEAQELLIKLEEHRYALEQEQQAEQKATKQSQAHQKKIDELGELIEELKSSIETEKQKRQAALEEKKATAETVAQDVEKLQQQATQTQQHLEDSQSGLEDILRQKQELERQTQELKAAREQLQKQIEKIEKEAAAIEAESNGGQEVGDDEQKPQEKQEAEDE